MNASAHAYIVRIPLEGEWTPERHMAAVESLDALVARVEQLEAALLPFTNRDEWDTCDETCMCSDCIDIQGARAAFRAGGEEPAA